MYADAKVTATLGGVRTRDWVAEYLDKQIAHWQQHGFGLWTVRDRNTGVFIGRCGLRQVEIDGRHEVEITYGLMAEFWGRGLATEMAAECVRVGFVELKRAELVCFTLPTNLASRRVMEKVGFRYERDIVWADLPHVLCRQRSIDYRLPD
jgi:RimJ/RimL family protein N-acetyltransferase